MKTPIWLKRFERNFNLLRSGLNYSEIERLIKSETPTVYEFYSREIQKPDHKGSFLIRTFVLARNLFITFIIKMAPIRRFIYILGILLFFHGLIAGMLLSVLFGFLLINLLLAFEMADKLTAKDELEIARQIQTTLIPNKAPTHPLFDIAFFMETAREVGGDFFDFLTPADNNSVVVLVGDISGKGMAAALHMVQVNTVVQSLQKRELIDMLVELNGKMYPLLKPAQFVTVSLAHLLADGAVRIARAGHFPFIHYSSRTKFCTKLTPSGIGIGLSDNVTFAKTIEQITIQPEKNDILVLYSDGLVETRDRNKVEFGETALENLIKTYANLPAKGIQETILRKIITYRGVMPPHDDVTLIVIKAV